jgi:uncharacterized protein YaiE (UPF0345 family)
MRRKRLERMSASTQPAANSSAKMDTDSVSEKVLGGSKSDVESNADFDLKTEEVYIYAYVCIYICMYVCM